MKFTTKEQRKEKANDKSKAELGYKRRNTIELDEVWGYIEGDKVLAVGSKKHIDLVLGRLGKEIRLENFTPLRPSRTLVHIAISGYLADFTNTLPEGKLLLLYDEDREIIQFCSSEHDSGYYETGLEIIQDHLENDPYATGRYGDLKESSAYVTSIKAVESKDGGLKFCLGAITLTGERLEKKYDAYIIEEKLLKKYQGTEYQQWQPLNKEEFFRMLEENPNMLKKEVKLKSGLRENQVKTPFLEEDFSTAFQYLSRVLVYQGEVVGYRFKTSAPKGFIGYLDIAVDEFEGVFLEGCDEGQGLFKIPSMVEFSERLTVANGYVEFPSGLVVPAAELKPDSKGKYCTKYEIDKGTYVKQLRDIIEQSNYKGGVSPDYDRAMERILMLLFETDFSYQLTTPDVANLKLPYGVPYVENYEPGEDAYGKEVIPVGLHQNYFSKHSHLRESEWRLKVMGYIEP